MFRVACASWFRRRGRDVRQIEKEDAVDRLAQQLVSDAVRLHGWLDAGIWGAAVSKAEARDAIVRHVAVTGDE